MPYFFVSLVLFVVDFLIKYTHMHQSPLPEFIVLYNGVKPGFKKPPSLTGTAVKKGDCHPGGG
jgi:hypothetical protein